MTAQLGEAVLGGWPLNFNQLHSAYSCLVRNAHRSQRIAMYPYAEYPYAEFTSIKLGNAGGDDLALISR